MAAGSRPERSVARRVALKAAAPLPHAENRKAKQGAMMIEIAATLTDEVIDLYDQLVGSFFTRSNHKYERAFAEQGKTINDKVWLGTGQARALASTRLLDRRCHRYEDHRTATTASIVRLHTLQRRRTPAKMIRGTPKVSNGVRPVCIG